MKNLLAVILLALCALVVTSNSSQAQDDLPSWTVIVHGEYGYGLFAGATVEIFDDTNSRVFGPSTSQSNGEVGFIVPTGFKSGNYRVHVSSSSHSSNDVIVYYSSGPAITNINVGAPY